MKIYLWSIGKAHEEYVKQGIQLFTNRISNYFNVEWKIIPLPKNSGSLSAEDLKEAEGSTILNLLQKDYFLILLDENGKTYSSESFSKLLQTTADTGVKHLVFLIGGAYGVSEPVRKRANVIWSLSLLVFPHQLVRLIVAEQVYRACTILRNEKYHHP